MNDITTETKQPGAALIERAPEVGDMFTTLAAFEAGQRMASALSKMALLPTAYKDNIPNCMMLLSLAHAFRHMNITPFMIAQQLVPVQGKYGWQGQFVIAVINASRRFEGDLDFVFDGEGDQYGCTAVATRRDGREIRGTKVTLKMAKDEGWYGKSGSKWQTMADQMFRYRAGAFFGRVYCPDLLMGMSTVDELEDMVNVTPQQDRGADLTTKILGMASVGKPLERPDVAKLEEDTVTLHTADLNPAKGGQPSSSVTMPKGSLSNLGKVSKSVDDIFADLDEAERERS